MSPPALYDRDPTSKDESKWSKWLIAVTMLSVLNTGEMANYGVYGGNSASYAAYAAERVEALAPANASFIGPNVDNTKSSLTEEGYVALKLVYNSGRITFELVESVINTFLSSLGFGAISENLRINYLGLGLDVSSGLQLEFMLQIDEVYTFELGIKRIKVSIDSEKKVDYQVVLNSEFTEEGLVGIPEHIYVETSFLDEADGLFKRHL